MRARPFPGIVVYRGPSSIDGAPIVAILTFDSHNTKTGPMAQAWILRADVRPTEAIHAGADRSICGNCIHRSGSAIGRSCYVVPWLGPLNVYKSLVAGQYPDVDLADAHALVAGEALRLAAYGDPAAAPYRVWLELIRAARGFTAYTHQWRTCDQRFRFFAMASVESPREADAAHQLGWRTFRTRTAAEAVRADEIVCPASDEAGHRVTCERCTLCVGTRRPAARSIVIAAHGQRTAWFDRLKERVSA